MGLMRLINKAYLDITSDDYTIYSMKSYIKTEEDLPTKIGLIYAIPKKEGLIKTMITLRRINNELLMERYNFHSASLVTITNSKDETILKAECVDKRTIPDEREQLSFFD